MSREGGVLQKERKESECRGRSVEEGERGECMSRVTGGVLQKEIEESVCRGRSVAEGERGECMCCVGGVCGFEQQLQAIWASLDKFRGTLMLWGVET